MYYATYNYYLFILVSTHWGIVEDLSHSLALQRLVGEEVEEAPSARPRKALPQHQGA